MPPSTTPEPQSRSAKRGRSSPRKKRTESIASPIAKPTMLERAVTAPEVREDLATTFKADLTSIRNLVTCSICDQLLYEPFTIQCGHTYCYSCLCSWFVPNKKKKTCPECRMVIKQMPAPSFMVKQMVEIFVKRVELMPPDESVDQHTIKRSEEIAAVEQDRSSQQGLFKGLFPPKRLEPIIDEADGVQRCPHCNTEYLGGPHCLTCGGEIDYDGFDYSGDDLDELEALEEEFEDEIESDLGRVDRGPGAFVRRLFFDHARRHYQHHNHLSHARRRAESSPSGASSLEESQESEHSESESESEGSGSMQDFIVNDESPVSHHGNPPRHGHNRVPVEEASSTTRSPSRDTQNEYNDDSDEDGPIVRGPRRGYGIPRAPVPPRVPVIDLTDDEDDDASDVGESSNVAERLRYDGWSPLHESENDEHDAGDSTDASDGGNGVDNNSDDESDTETMVGNDDDRGRVTYRWRRRGPTYRSGTLDDSSDQDDSISEAGMSSIVDGDGDTDMSVSPDGGGFYGHYPESMSSRDSRLGDDEYGNSYDVRTYNRDFDDEQNLGYGHDLHDVEDDASDDDTPQPPNRRFHSHTQGQSRSYSPRISQMLARHQHMRNESGNHTSFPRLSGVAGGNGLASQRADSHSHGRSSSSRNPPIAVDFHSVAINQLVSPRRGVRSPSVSHIISSSIRPARVERQYQNDRRGVRAQAYWS